MGFMLLEAFVMYLLEFDVFRPSIQWTFLPFMPWGNLCSMLFPLLRFPLFNVIPSLTFPLGIKCVPLFILDT